jgi:hypothetical protein
MTLVVAPANVNAAFTGLELAGIYTTTEVTAQVSDLPVVASSSGAIRTMARIVVPVAAGDVLDLDGRQRVTNDVGPSYYTVGIGYWWDAYDVDDGLDSADPAKVWTRVSPANGQNVDRSVVHHLPLTLVGDVYRVPETWPPGHRMVVCFRANAASTAYGVNGGGDKVTVDSYGAITVRRYRPKVDDPRWSDLTTLQDQVAALAAQVAALTPQEA